MCVCVCVRVRVCLSSHKVANLVAVSYWFDIILEALARCRGGCFCVDRLLRLNSFFKGDTVKGTRMNTDNAPYA